MHIAFDLDSYEATEQALSEALTSIRDIITLRKNNPNLDRDATLELILQTSLLQTSRLVDEAASLLPPVQ